MNCCNCHRQYFRPSPKVSDSMGLIVDNGFNVLLAVSLCLPRMLVALYFLPGLGFTQMPMSLKAGIVIGVSMPVMVGVLVHIDAQPLSPILMTLLILKEGVVGFFLGFLLAMPFWIFQSMGALIDNQRGALSAGYFDPASGPDASMLGDLLSRALMVYFIQMGVFAAMFKMLLTTYALWPPLLALPEIPIDGYEMLIAKFGYLVETFMLYAGPVVLVLLLVESTFAVLGAYSPQMQVYFMAMPAKAMTALIIFVLFFDHVQQLMQYQGDLLLTIPSILRSVLGEAGL